MYRKISVLALVLFIGAIGAYAQGAQTQGTQLRSLTAGQKYKVKGVVVSKENDSTFIVRDTVGVDTKVIVAPNASIKNNSFFGGDKYPAASIIRGLNLDVEGVGDSTGSLSANKVRFDKNNLMTARSIDSRVTPAEDRLTAAEQNAQRVSGQIDELMAISNAAKGGAKAAQDTADAAVAGVNATNKRISDLDDYVVQSTATVNFKVGSAVLSPEAKSSLDQIATASTTLKGYTIEVTGFASADGDTKKNKVLSERRAQAVKDYLIETHNIPLRRIGTSYGFGELQAVADNSTREGREQNRRVEVKLLVSRGINQNVEVKAQTKDPNEQ
jgi:outer membrane protein OmpA-like peptidoglycan-associated protein